MSSRPTVLVVDDEPELRQLVADALDARGFAVAQAGDVSDALSRLEGFAYDGLVLDFFRVCTEHLDHDQPMPLEPFPMPTPVDPDSEAA